jgi:hypothetical protein
MVCTCVVLSVDMVVFVALQIRINSSNWNSSCEMELFVIMLSWLCHKNFKNSVRVYQTYPLVKDTPW